MDISIKMLCPSCEKPSLKDIGTIPLYINKNKSDITEWDRFPLLECTSCGTITTDIPDEKIKQHLSIAGHTDPRNDKLHSSRIVFFSYLQELLLNFNTMDFFTEHTTVDLGCSFGNFTKLLFDQGWRVVGIERNPETLEYAREKNPSIMFYEDLSQLPDNSCACVLIIDSLYYVKHPIPLLNEINKKLVNDGIVLVRITNRTWFVRLLRLFNKGKYKDSPIGVAAHAFSDKGLKVLFDKTGFNTMKTVYYEKKLAYNKLTKIYYEVSGRLADLFHKNLFNPGIIGIFKKR